jgi:hypothetical protein
MRPRIPTTKPGELKAGWARVDGNSPSVAYNWGGGGAAKSDARILSNALEEVHVHDGKTLIEELEARGYDLSTLRFSIKLKTPTI